MASVTETLREALEHCGQTRYAVSKATGIPQSTLSRFVAEGRALRGDNIDTLAEYLGLELVPGRTTTKKRRGSHVV
jgi:plasmid maintenance system antidote protein VapI